MLRLGLRVVVVSTLVGAAVIHAAQAPSHVAEWWAVGVTFVGLAAAQAVLGAAAAVRADRWVWRLAQAVSLAAIGLWAVSRTVGLPVGPQAGVPEPVGRADLAVSGLEAATVLAATLLLWPGAAAPGHRPGRSATILAVAIAGVTGAVAWYGVQPISVCEDHDAAHAELGPLVPVEGHSLLAATTPIATAAVGQRVGLVVGLLRNCATAPITLQAARLLNQDGEGHTVTVGRFWVASSPPARPGSVLPATQLGAGQLLAGRVIVQPTSEAPTQALVLEVRTRHPGRFRVDAVTVSYQSGRRGYSAPFATNAQLTIGQQQHHHAARLDPAEANPMPTWWPLSRIRTRRPDRTRRLRRYWDRHARSYDRQMAFFERVLFGDGRQWVCAQATGDVLEVAVGGGRNLAFYPQGIRLTGIDFSPQMLQLAQRRAQELGRQVDLRLGDAQALELPDASFDTVVCTLSLCAISDERRAIAEMRRVLRPGGRLLLLDHVAAGPWLGRAVQWLLERATVPLGGEHLRRRPLLQVQAEGFDVEQRERYKLGIVERLAARNPT